jgi:uncharacterized membrane protein
MRRSVDAFNILLLLALVGFALWAWPRLPDRIPTHFGVGGEPDRWADRSWASWFGVPGVAVGLTLLMAGVRVLIRTHPRWVNLPDRRRLSDLPPLARGPVLEVVSTLLALVQTELLVIFGLIMAATFRTSMGNQSRGIMITVLLLAILTSPVLLVVFFLGLQRAMERGKELVRRAEAGVSGSGGPA